MSGHRSVFRSLIAIGCAGLMVALINVTGASANHATTHITGTVGEIVDPDATSGGFFLRYVGDPAPDGYSHNYQWDNPFIEAQPDAGAVSFDGTLDLTGRMSDNSVAMIGLLDKAGLESGSDEHQKGAYIYVNNRPDGSVRIGPTDGNVGGEIVQEFVTVPPATADAGPLGVTFAVDGTAEPATCATSPADVPSADGCMTLDITGFPTISDSYGSITGSGGPDEFATGAIPGWEAFPSEGAKVGYDLVVSPATADPQNKEQCMNGGWEDFGFRNQGQCIRFVQTGQDSREGG